MQLSRPFNMSNMNLQIIISSTVLKRNHCIYIDLYNFWLKLLQNVSALQTLWKPIMTLFESVCVIAEGTYSEVPSKTSNPVLPPSGGEETYYNLGPALIDTDGDNPYSDVGDVSLAPRLPPKVSVGEIYT